MYYIKLNKYKDFAEITAFSNKKRVGVAELTKQYDQWNLQRLYIDEAKDKITISNKLIEKIHELQQDTDPAINSIITYLQKD